MYSIVGGLLHGSILCIDCLRKALKDDESLTDEEIGFLISGPDHGGNYMDLWPLRVKLNDDTFHHHVYDDGGDVILQTNVHVSDKDWIHGWESDAEFGLLNSGDESEEGDYCEDCNEELLPPRVAECHEKEDGCEGRVATGYRAREVEDEYDYKEIMCQICYNLILQSFAETVEELIRAQVNTSTSDVAYWQVEIFIRAIHTMYHHDVYSHYGKVLSIADEAENTALAQCFKIFEEELEYSDLTPEVTKWEDSKEKPGQRVRVTYTYPEKQPAFLWLLEKEHEHCYETDPTKQVAPVPALTRLGLDPKKIQAVQLQLAGLQ